DELGGELHQHIACAGETGDAGCDVTAARQGDDMRIARQRRQHRSHDEEGPVLERARAADRADETGDGQEDEAGLHQRDRTQPEFSEEEKPEADPRQQVRPGSDDLRQRAHRYRAVWIGLPATESAASRKVSASVGCAWIVAMTSSTVASRRIARVASAISSDAWGPAMCTPTMRRSLPAATIFVVPAVSPRATARPDAANGKRAIFTASPNFSLACASVRPTEASSG